MYKFLGNDVHSDTLERKFTVISEVKKTIFEQSASVRGFWFQVSNKEPLCSIHAEIVKS